MNRLILLCCASILMLISTTNAQDKTEDGWKEIVKNAAAQEKFIFVESYTDWCRYCKLMDKTVFADEEVKTTLDKGFVFMKLNAEDQGFGSEFAKKHDVRGYPTMLVFNTGGEMVHRYAGSLNTEAFLQLLKDSKNPEKQLITLKKLYTSGKADPDVLFEYANALNRAGMDNTKVANEYLNTQKKMFVSKKNWDFIRFNIFEIDNPHFQNVVENKNKFSDITSKSEVDKFITFVWTQEIIRVAKLQDKEKLTGLHKKIDKVAPENKQALNSLADYRFYKSTASGYDYAQIYFDNYCTDWSEFNEIAWDIFENTDHPERVEQGIKWIEKSIQLDKNWYNTDTYANLLFKAGKLQEALNVAEESMNIGQSAGEDVSETKALYEKIFTQIENQQ